MKIRALVITLFVAVLGLAPIGASAARVDATHWGIISSITGNVIKFDNGMTVRMREGTIIEPTGAPLYPGMHVRVKGVRDAHGVIIAHIIDKVGARH